MLDIVRLKESKMVNVASRIPFYFQNNVSVKDVSSSGVLVEPFSLTPTCSRSVSASSLPQDALCSRPFLPRVPMYASRFQPRSRSSSVTFPNDWSTTEIYPENDRSSSGSRVRNSCSPVFNIRLVRGLSPRLSTPDVRDMRRGRRRKKPNSEDDHSAGADNMLTSISSQDTQSASQAEGLANPQVSLTIIADGGSDTAQISSGEAAPVLTISPAPTADFTLFDIGPLIISWDD